MKKELENPKKSEKPTKKLENSNPLETMAENLARILISQIEFEERASEKVDGRLKSKLNPGEKFAQATNAQFSPNKNDGTPNKPREYKFHEDDSKVETCDSGRQKT